MTRDEILDAINRELFSVRNVFYTRLDEASWFRPVGQDLKVKAKWPEALAVISLEQWKDAYEAAIQFRDERRGVTVTAQ